MRISREEQPSNGSAPWLVVVEPAAERGIRRELERLFVDAWLRLRERLQHQAERFLGRQDAEDAVGDAILSLWRRWPSLAPEQRSDRYIMRAVTYSAFAKRRALKQFESLEDAELEIADREAKASLQPTRGETAGDVLDLVLAAMAPRRRSAFMLVREQDCTYQEAAESLGVSVDSIKTHLRLATRQLRTEFARAGLRVDRARAA